MLTTAMLNAFATRDTQVIADALINHSLIGTDVGDRVLAAVSNSPERHAALVHHLQRRNAWEAVA